MSAADKFHEIAENVVLGKAEREQQKLEAEIAKAPAEAAKEGQ